MAEAVNDQLVLISGESGSGKSASLQNIYNQERWLYLNCEAGKRLPFRNKFESVIITDPYDVHACFEQVNGDPNFDGVIVDTVTFLMEMFESLYIVGSNNTQSAWGDYFQFFKTLMQKHVAGSDKSVIFLGHTRSEYDEKALENRVAVPVKGALKNNGIEAYFSTVVSTKKIEVKKLDDYQSELLTLSERDKELGFKHVFQTQLTKATTGERIRSPMTLFTREQTYMDNDAQMLLNHLKAFYA